MKSHVIPRWAYKRVKGPDGKQWLIKPDRDVETNEELKRPLLCAECDNHRLGQLDDHASRVLLQKDGRFPLVSTTQMHAPSDGGTRVRYGYVEQPEKLRDFILSVVWRTHAYGKSFPAHQRKRLQYNPNVDLGPYAEPVRLHLLNGTPLPPRLCVYAWTFWAEDERIRGLLDGFYLPTRRRSQTHFFLAGMRAGVVTGSQGDSLKQLALMPKGLVVHRRFDDSLEFQKGLMPVVEAAVRRSWPASAAESQW